MIYVRHLAGKTVAVLGLGRTGLSAARSLVSSGASVMAWDDHEEKRAEALVAGIPVIDLAAADFASINLLVLSPGIPHTFPEPHPVTVHARQAGVRIVCDVELLCEALPDADMIAITGTNGKSTTTALVGHILAGFRPTVVGGNIGWPVLEATPTHADTAFVLELSSYQLELTPGLNPRGAILLNITPDHIDRHGSLEGYIAAKFKMFDNSAPDAHGRKPVAVIAIDTPHTLKIADALAEKRHMECCARVYPGTADRRCCCYQW